MLDVYLWSSRCDLPEIPLATYASSLVAEEETRARAFHFQRDRQRFIAARGFLRNVLGQHLGLDPSRVRLLEAPGAKPRLEMPASEAPLAFSLSRSAGTVLIGVVRGRHIGVDLEHVRELQDLDSLAATVLSKREQGLWYVLPCEHRLEHFYTVWTRKEAVAKAQGRGITEGPHRFEVPFEPLAPSRWVFVDGLQPSSRWMMSGWVSAPDKIGCIVLQSLSRDHLAGTYEDIAFGESDRVPSESATGAHLMVPPHANLVIRRFCPLRVR